tara:strand:+ start:541 stop:915 length:375 start_codon:yes stop_codon:yes gene_type:complete
MSRKPQVSSHLVNTSFSEARLRNGLAFEAVLAWSPVDHSLNNAFPTFNEKGSCLKIDVEIMLPRFFSLWHSNGAVAMRSRIAGAVIAYNCKDGERKTLLEMRLSVSSPFWYSYLGPLDFSMVWI